MDDYYKILNVNNKSTKEEIIKSYNDLISNYKILPSEKNKYNIKLIKKAFFVLTNDKYKKIYDTNLSLKQPHLPALPQQISALPQQISASSQQIPALPHPNVINKKGHINNSYIANRIFSFNDVVINKKICNIDDSELLRPKSVGLGSDIIPEYDTPLDFDPTQKNEILPFEHDSK